MRTLALALALAAGALSVTDYLGWRAAQRRLAQLAAEVDPDHRLPGLTAGLTRETVAARAGARLAWRLLQRELDRSWLTELPEDERRAESRRDLDRLRLARRLSEEVLRQQPASWRAATIVGACRYLEASRRSRWEQPIESWQGPLEVALGLAPGQSEPATILASIYLSRWSSLSGAERQKVPAAMARAFVNREVLRLLLPAWIQLAPSLDTLLEPIPDRPDAWRELGRRFLGLGDLERFGVSHQRWIESQAADLADRVERGRARLRGRQPRAGLGLLYSVFAAPPDLLYVDSFAAALAALPEDAATNDAREDLAAWLDWARALCAIGNCPLDEAAMTLLRATAGDAAGPPPALDLRARSSWPRDEWRFQHNMSWLSLRLARPAERLRLEIAGVPPEGAAIELRWDGTFLGVAVVGPGEPLSWPLAAVAGPHLLQFRRLDGRPVWPRALTLEPAEAPG